MRKHDDALILAAILDGAGGARELRWDDIDRWRVEDGVLWLHFYLDEPQAREWLVQRSGLDPIVCNALLMPETRPRAVVIGDGLLLMLRGVNLNPGAEPEDMVSVRVWADAQRVITVRRRKLMGMQDLIDDFAVQAGPRNAAEFVVKLSEYITTRMAPVIAQIHENLDSIEEEVLTRRDAEIRGRLSEIRRRVIRLRRFIGPQRDTLTQMVRERLTWFGPDDMTAMREVAFAITRHLEDLDVAREQAIVTHDELTAYVGEQLGRTMYFLALVTTFFLPITFLAGLLGMNIGGLPGVPAEQHPDAFALTIAAMVAIIGFQLWIFRRWRLMK
jgi:zinc transporter